jgi:Flp pilus assembly protein TadD
MTFSPSDQKVLKLKREIAESIDRGDFQSAEAACSKLMRIVSPAEGKYVKGILREAQGNHSDALELLKAAFRQMPHRGDIAYNLGVAWRGAGRLAEAAAAWRESVKLAPGHLDGWRNLCLAVAETEGFGAAADLYRQALLLHPQDRILLYNYGNNCYRRNDLEEALGAQTKLIKLYPDFAAGWNNAGMILKAAGLYEQAESCYRQCIRLNNPADLALAHFNLANLLLLQERWAEGFAEYEWRLKLSDAPSPPWTKAAWTPKLPAGSRVLLWNDQGMGDGIQFLRFASRLADHGFRVFVFIQEPLKTLAATAPGVEAAFSPSDPPCEIDAHLPMCRLPNVLGVKSEEFWTGIYLSAPSDLERFTSGNSGRATCTRRVGLVWAGNPDHKNDHNRSIHLDHLRPLLRLSGIEWFSLQVGRDTAELTTSPWAGRIHDLSPRLSDFSATAAVMEQLDLLISVDTAAIHLSGALGRPTWVFLPKIESDWRWGIEGEKTIWYPDLRLFRQEKPGDWRGPVERMVALLSEWL